MVGFHSALRKYRTYLVLLIIAPSPNRRLKFYCMHAVAVGWNLSWSQDLRYEDDVQENKGILGGSLVPAWRVLHMKPQTSSEARDEKFPPRAVIADVGAAAVRPIFACETAENSNHRFDHWHLLNQVALCSRSRSFPAATTDGFGLSKWLTTQSQRNVWVNSSSGSLPRAKQVQLPSTASL